MCVCVVLGADNTLPARCLDHSFTVHTHYELAPPYPPFVPHISLSCPGVAVFNTGDSLVVLDIHTDTAVPCCAAMSHDSTDVHVDDVADVEGLFGSESPVLPPTASQLSSDTSELLSSPSDVTDSRLVEPRVSRHLNLSSSKENRLKLSVNAGSSEQRLPVSECRCDSVESCEPYSDSDVSVKAASSVLPNTIIQPPANLSHTASDSLQSTVVLSSPDESAECSAVFEFPQLTVVPLQLCGSGAGLNVGMYRTLCGHVSNSSPVILQNDTECFTYSIRRYSSDATSTDVEGRHTYSYSLFTE